jgi:hypothetical protein
MRYNEKKRINMALDLFKDKVKKPKKPLDLFPAKTPIKPPSPDTPGGTPASPPKDFFKGGEISVTPDMDPAPSKKQSMYNRILNIGAKMVVGPGGNLVPKETRDALETSGERTLNNIAIGAVSSFGSIASGIDWLIDSDVAEDIGKKTREWARSKSPPDPNFVDSIAQGVGSAATFFIPGLGLAKGSSLLGLVAPRLAAWIGVGASTALESMAEAGGVYQSVIEETGNEEEANRAATKTFLMNVPLIAVSNKLGVFGERGGRIRKTLSSGLFEGLQEGGQEIISAANQGEDIRIKDVATAIGVGAIVGSGMGAIAGNTQFEEILAKKAQTGPASGGPSMNFLDAGIRSDRMNEQYLEVKDAWHGESDWQSQLADSDTAVLQDAIRGTTGEKKFGKLSQDIDKAIHVYIDLKRNPAHLERYYNELTPDQQRIVRLSQDLTDDQRAIADEVSEHYEALGLEAKGPLTEEEKARAEELGISPMEPGLIHNILENYVGRIWDLEKGSTEIGRRFGTTTRHGKARVFDTILEGWANDYTLKVEGATNSLSVIRQEVHNAIQNRVLVQRLSKMKTMEGTPLISTEEHKGYKRIENVGFKLWDYAGEAVPDKVYGKNLLVTPEGTLLERKEVYAPEHIAKNLNNMLGTSSLKGKKYWDAVTLYNATVKAWVLQSSFFHHMAFMRSYYLGGAPFGEAIHKIKSGEGFVKALKGLSPRQSYLAGVQAIKEAGPMFELLIRNGLTIGKIQEWEENLLREQDTFVGRILDKTRATKAIKDKVNAFRQHQADFLFKQFGAGLKAKAALIELQEMTRRHPNVDPNVLAKYVANLINDDFGGLHLKRMGRDPTNQHWFRLVALAPDWTESNIRSMVKAFGGPSKIESAMYRRFWARIITKSALAILAMNAILHGKDTPETYTKAWESGKLRWMDVDITPIYKAFGGETEAKKYFSIIGHFKDPLKWALDPIKSAQYKGSIVFGTIYDAIAGEDWAGREFTTIQELLATGRTVRPKFTFAPKPGDYAKVPSFLLNKLKGSQPIQVQQLLGWWAGETEGFDAIGRSLGAKVSTTYELDPYRKFQEKQIRREIRKLNLKKGRSRRRRR